MKKTKIIFAITLILFMLFTICFMFEGCSKKYDVSFKIHYIEVQDGKRVLPSLGEIIFDKDTDELYIEREYDGKEYEYFVVEYEDANHNTKNSYKKSQWKTVVGDIHFSLWKEGESRESLCETVCEKGNYCYTFYIVHGENIPEYMPQINTRILRLHISVI